MANKHILDIAKLPVTEAGIDHFYWPVRADEMYALYLSLLDCIIHYIRDAKKENIKSVDSAIILYHFFIFEVMSIYEAYLLLSRSKDEDISWSHTETNPWVSIIREHKSPKASFIIRRLQQGPSPLSKIRAPLRFARDLIVSKKEGMIRRSFRPCNYENDIVSLSINPLAIQHAKQIEDRIYYQRDQFWFARPNSVQPSENYSSIINAFLRCVKETLKEPSDPLLSYFKAWLDTAIPFSEAYLKQLDQRNDIPKRLWVSTASHLWGRILTRHVRKQGGHVTRFDHGSGCAYFSDSHVHGAHDYEDCDAYATFSANQAEAMKAAFTGEEVVQKTCPEIFSVIPKTATVHSSKLKSSPVIKKIMYVASIYPNGHFYSGAKGFMRNHVLLDWEIRLMAQLKEWGYEILFKPHPTEDICLEPPASIEKLFGPITLRQRFEDVYKQADLVLLDDPTTSLLTTLTRSDKPFVYLDFGVADFSLQALRLLKERCAIVKGRYDEKNRALMDWSELKESIENAWRYNDKSFYNHYF